MYMKILTGSMLKCSNIHAVYSADAVFQHNRNDC